MEELDPEGVKEVLLLYYLNRFGLLKTLLL